MKTDSRKILGFGAFGILSLVIVLFLLVHCIHAPNNSTRSNLHTLITSIPGKPVRLLIPTININAAIQNVGVTHDGAMAVPDTIADVGWFDLGVMPGQKGSAVISGHLDGKLGEPGVFINLSKLKKGDKLYTKDSQGKMTMFAVRENHVYNPGYADEVFSQNDTAHLNLITCDGLWNTVTKSYSKRLVVFADLAH